MAHGIYSNSDYASTQREWHGMGTLMAPDQTIEVWQEKSGLNYQIKKAFIRYPIARLNEDSRASELRTLDDKVVLFREDTGAPLGVVSEGYKIVQPREVLEFFREWADARGLTIESAGALFGGKRYFATAKIVNIDASALDARGREIAKPYVLLSTSADGSLATEAKLTAVRTVCNNTLNMARADGPAAVRVTHRSKFDAKAAKAGIGGLEAWTTFCQDMAKLVDKRVSKELAEDFVARLLATAPTDEAADKARESRGFARILALFEPRTNTMKLGAMKAQLPWSLEQADLSFCHTAGLVWDAAESLAPMGERARLAPSVEDMVRQVVAVARPGDHILCMSNGGFGGVHQKLLAALQSGAPAP